jgi:hypothetical protein
MQITFENYEELALIQHISSCEYIMQRFSNSFVDLTSMKLVLTSFSILDENNNDLALIENSEKKNINIDNKKDKKEDKNVFFIPSSLIDAMNSACSGFFLKKNYIFIKLLFKNYNNKINDNYNSIYNTQK